MRQFRVRRFYVPAAMSLAMACGGGSDATQPSAVASVTVSPATASVDIATTVQLTGTPKDATGNPVTGQALAWASQSPGVASVDGNGLVTGVSAGAAVVTATAGGHTGHATVTVNLPGSSGVASVVVAPATQSLNIAATVQLTATPKDAAGATVAGLTIAWASLAPGVATVNGSGLVTAVNAGTATVTATAGGVTGKATITVNPPAGASTVTVDPNTTFQTMIGWEATAQAGQVECNTSAFALYKNSLMDSTVELGINRLRLQVRSGAENPVDYFTQFVNGQITFAVWKSHWFEIINDNADPNTMAVAGFQFTEMDRAIDDVVLPIRQRLLARGEQLYVNLNYVDFGSSAFEHKAVPAEYGELLLAAFQHIQQKYGWVPDAVEMILEPDLAGWSGTEIGTAMVAASARLQAAGFTPDFIAPSNTSVSAAATWFDQMMAVPGAAAIIDELSYHRYSGVTDANLQALQTRAQSNGLRTSMLEHIGSDYNDLHKDLTLVRNSAWQQFAVAFCTVDDGAQYFTVNIANPAAPTFATASRTKFLRQYFRWVRRGAVRLGATSSSATFDPIAFRNVSGRFTVVVRTTGAGTFVVQGLPAGTYGTTYTTLAQFDQSVADVVIAAGQALAATIPAAGVITIHGR